jgi:ADP-ribosylglycohydrolase
MNTEEIRLSRAKDALIGLSVGDAFGEQYFARPDEVEDIIIRREFLDIYGEFTDDTNMALSVFATLRRYGKIDQDKLVEDFALRYDPRRKYGPAMHRMLGRVAEGENWREVAANLFAGGMGSFGNGAAMRVAPLGAYFADDLEAAIENAKLSAEITHSHPEGVAGAIAVAVATAFSWLTRNSTSHEPKAFLNLVLPHVPDSKVKSLLEQARNLPEGASVQLAVSVLGNGSQITAQDTVPFALWCAAQQLNDFEEALWLTVSGLGDRDTTCAIVGGILGARLGVQKIPAQWLERREALPNWTFSD